MENVLITGYVEIGGVLRAPGTVLSVETEVAEALRASGYAARVPSGSLTPIPDPYPQYAETGALLRDDFQRANGPLGDSLHGGAWSNVGAGAMEIIDNEMTLPGTGVLNAYAAVTVATKPTFIGARCYFSDATNSGTATILTTSGTTFDSANLGVHLVAKRTTAVFQIRQSNGAFIDLATWGYDPIPAGQPFVFGCWLDGDQVHALGPNGIWRTFTDSRVRTITGRVIAFQCNRDGASQATARWTYVAASSNPVQELPYVTGPMLSPMLSRLFDDSSNLISRGGTVNQVKVGQTAAGYPGFELGPVGDGNRVMAVPGLVDTLIGPTNYYLSGNVDTAIYRSAAGVVRSTGSIAAAGSAWNSGHLILGNYHLWVDAGGSLRMKNGAPTSDSDGAVVGA